MSKNVRFALIPGLLFILLVSLGFGGKQLGESPTPINIDRSGGPPTIPEVPRDEVICFALYTVHNEILKLSAQLYPLQQDEDKSVGLEIENNGTWKEIGRSPVDTPGWLATFRVEGWFRP